MVQLRINGSTRIKLDDLADILYYRGYFGFKQDAQNYVNGIYDFIATIPQQKHYKTKTKKYGAYYCRYKPNRKVKTTYYITFDKEPDLYLVKNIISNHTTEYSKYISRNTK